MNTDNIVRSSEALTRSTLSNILRARTPSNRKSLSLKLARPRDTDFLHYNVMVVQSPLMIPA
jgi:hypothetical protein